METRLAEFKVRTVGLAARCEVCHLDDLFNPETGKCARCQDALAALETSPPATIRAPVAATGTRPSRKGLKLAQTAAVLSTLMAIPGTVIPLSTLSLVLTTLRTYRATGNSSLFFGATGGILGFTVVGFYQLYWYWKILKSETRSNQRKKLWGCSAIYNWLLFLILIHQSPEGSFHDPLSVFWLGLLALMTMISGLAFLEEYKPR
jgi:hypothetical protein